MTPRLPAVSGEAAAKALGRAGFERISQRGSHIKLRDHQGRTVIVPRHRELARGTLRSILKQANITIEDFAQLL
ncbi:MAG: hypothetical protein DCC49_00730 [Acidobacteria bacterium]|nr:MAG: hypothetical protein DCC49_00730 [Acidobacteriota bacterium]